MWQSIKEFHEKFDLSPIGSKPSLLPVELMDFRFRCIDEEVSELKAAYIQRDLHETADALIDAIYFLLGTGYLMNLPMDKLFDNVHQANMNKIRVKSANDSKRFHAYDVKKPEGWKQPDFTEWLGEKL